MIEIALGVALGIIIAFLAIRYWHVLISIIFIGVVLAILILVGITLYTWLSEPLEKYGETILTWVGGIFLLSMYFFIVTFVYFINFFENENNFSYFKDGKINPVIIQNIKKDYREKKKSIIVFTSLLIAPILLIIWGVVDEESLNSVGDFLPALIVLGLIFYALFIHYPIKIYKRVFKKKN